MKIQPPLLTEYRVRCDQTPNTGMMQVDMICNFPKYSQVPPIARLYFKADVTPLSILNHQVYINQSARHHPPDKLRPAKFTKTSPPNIPIIYHYPNMSSTTIAITKFVGTISLGLLTVCHPSSYPSPPSPSPIPKTYTPTLKTPLTLTTSSF